MRFTLPALFFSACFRTTAIMLSTTESSCISQPSLPHRCLAPVCHFTLLLSDYKVDVNGGGNDEPVYHKRSQRPVPQVPEEVLDHEEPGDRGGYESLSLIHISEPTRLGMISYAV